jgi:arylformamidase
LIARMPVGAGEVGVDLARPVHLAIPLELDGPQPRHFGAEAARSRPFVSGAFSGEVGRGASCNCRTITLTPHCNGTHTEGVGHLTRDPFDAHRAIPTDLIPALLLSVSPEAAGQTTESAVPAPAVGDSLITHRALRASRERARAHVPRAFVARALVIRTLPNETSKRTRDYTSLVPPYLTLDAASALVADGIEHLVLDVPSVDRTHDEGRLACHRVFFGLPAQSTRLADASRAQCTITELAYVPDDAPDGAWFLAIHAPAISGDAVPSRPLLYRLLA